MLRNYVDSMKADYIAVIDHERLYNDLMQLYQRGSQAGGGGPGSPPGIKVVKLTKSGGVVTRPAIFRRKARMNKYEYSSICYLLFVICYLLFVICYLLFVICYLLFVICYLLFVICYLLFFDVLLNIIIN